jgi:hypothetical protein
MATKQFGQPAPIRIILSAYGEPHTCKYLPTGWRDHSSSWIFDYKTFGFDRKYSTEKLRFIKEDADFIRRQIDLHGISAEIDFKVEHRQNDWTYAESFTGGVDLSAGYINDRDFVEVGVTEGGFKRSYAANQRTNYELPLNDADAVDIEVPEGMGLYEIVKYNIDEIGPLWAYWYDRDYLVALQYPVLNIDKEKSNILTDWLVFNTQKRLESDGSTPVPFITTRKDNDVDDNGIIITVKNTRIIARIIGKLTYDRSMGNYHNRSKETLIYITENGRNARVIARLPAGYFDVNDDVYIDSTLEINIRKSTINEYVFCYRYSKIDTKAPHLSSIRFFGKISVGYVGIKETPSFLFKALSAENVADKLVKKIHDNSASCPMPFLPQVLPPNSQLFLTSGDGIRGIPEALIKTNFQEFQNNLACLFDTGTRISNKENTYEIVDKTVIFNPAKLLLDLGTVKEMQIKPIPDEWLFNNISVGYEKQEYDYPLGRQDFACILEYANELKIPNKKENWVSKYRADYTGVHLLYYDYVNNDKKDSKSDNDIFWVLAFQKDGKWQAIQGEGISLSGLEGGGYFNILLSPHRNLLQHRNYLKSILDKHSESLTYTTSTETQTNIRSTYNGKTIREKDSEDVTSGTVLFKPIIFEFDALIKKNLSEVLGENPDGYVTFKFNGVTCKGFPIEIAGSITDSSQKVTCLAHPDTPNNIQEIMFKRLPNKLY